MKNPFDNVMEQLRRATAIQSFPDSFITKLSRPHREIHISIPIVLDDGNLKIFEGYRVQYNNARGPYKGGLRYHQYADIDEIKALAFLMVIKCAIANIPMGGGKGGITVDPSTLSRRELEALSRGWVRGMADVLGPQKDIPAPDMNTTPEIMSWMADEFEKVTGDKTNATFTGKPIASGGSEGRSAATGTGGFYVFDSLRTKYALPERCNIVIQGFGNVGSNAASIFSQHHRIVAISDVSGGIAQENGINIPGLLAYRAETGKISGFPGTRAITNAELLETQCDVLIPAALENQITGENAHRVRAKIIFELANGPTTPEADEILFGKGIPVVPDVLANAGGVIVSNFEWEQNLNHAHWSEEEVLMKLKKILDRESIAIYEKSILLKTDLRRAAFIVALKRIANAMGYHLASSSPSTADQK